MPRRDRPARNPYNGSSRMVPQQRKSSDSLLMGYLLQRPRTAFDEIEFPSHRQPHRLPQGLFEYSHYIKHESVTFERQNLQRLKKSDVEKQESGESGESGVRRVKNRQEAQDSQDSLDPLDS